jgi:HAD superfamily hydrolase (TIGR01549 family)
MARHYWVFDLDGTLTVPVHDFDSMRRELGLAPGKPILEEIATLPQEKAWKISKKLDHMEFQLALKAKAQAGAGEVLETLCVRGCRVGIFTRNSERTARETLKRCGLARFFKPKELVTRETCAPKPSPQGIYLLLARWGAKKEQAVMVGDYLYDMVSGREAGVVTVGFDGKGNFPWEAHADYVVPGLSHLLDLPIFPL